MALAWAVEPSALRLPLEHAVLAVPPEPALPLWSAELPLLSFLLPLLLQAASAVTVSSTPAARPARLSFTLESPSSIDLSRGTLRARSGGGGGAWWKQRGRERPPKWRPPKPPKKTRGDLPLP